MHVGGLGRRILAAEGARRRLECAQLRGQPARGLLSEPGADPPDIGETPAAVYAREQRPQLSFTKGPAAYDHFVSRAALGLEPGVAPPGAIPRIEAFRHDTLQRHPASRLQDRLGTRLEMLDVAKAGRAGREQLRKALLAR